MKPMEYGVLGLLLSSFLTVSEIVPQIVGYFSTAIVFAVVCVWVLANKRPVLVGSKTALILYFAVCLGFITAFLFQQSYHGLGRLLAFIGFTTVIVFVFPQYLDPQRIWYFFAIATAIITIIGLPTLKYDMIGIGPLTISAWSASTVLFGINVNILSSIFANPNTLSAVCCFATVGVIVTQPPTKSSISLASMNFLGVVLSGSRAGLLATIVGVSMYFVAYYGRRSVTTIATASGILGLSIITLVISQVTPSIPVLETFNLGGRRVLWSASIDAFHVRPIGFGTIDTDTVIAPYITDSRWYGNDPHNSFLRIMLMGGVLSGVAYVALHIYALMIGSRLTMDNQHKMIALLWAAIIFHFFDATTIFGLSAISTVPALILGHTIHDFNDLNR